MPVRTFTDVANDCCNGPVTCKTPANPSVDNSPLSSHFTRLKNFSMEALRILQTSTSESSDNSSGPDSPYSRLSRNLSQLLDEADAEDEAKLLEKMSNRGVGSAVSLSSSFVTSPTPSTSYNTTKTIIVTIWDNCDDHQVKDILAVLATCGQIVHYSQISKLVLLVDYLHAEDAINAQSFLDGYTFYPSGQSFGVRLVSRPDSAKAKTANPSRSICITFLVNMF